MSRWSDVSALTMGGSTSANEDWVAFSDTALVVVDGATGLTGCHIMEGWASDAQWLARRLGDMLLPALGRSERPIKTVIQECLSVLRQEFLEHCSDDVDLEDIQPSAGVVLARLIGDQVEVFRLGDAMGVIGLRDGTVDVCREERLEALDSAVLHKMVHLSSTQHIPLKDTRSLVADDLIQNRRLLNTPEGYWTVDLTGRGVDHGQLEQWDADQVEDILLMTDGFEAAIHPLAISADPADLLSTVRRGSVWDVASAVVELLASDPEWNKYPRFKDRDDASIIRACIPPA